MLDVENTNHHGEICWYNNATSLPQHRDLQPATGLQGRFFQMVGSGSTFIWVRGSGSRGIKRRVKQSLTNKFLGSFLGKYIFQV